MFFEIRNVAISFEISKGYIRLSGKVCFFLDAGLNYMHMYFNFLFSTFVNWALCLTYQLYIRLS